MSINYKELQDNLIDVAKEVQIKLGTSKQPVSLYYPLAALNRMFGTALDVAQMSETLKDFAEYAQTTLGQLEISVDRGRFCIKIGEAGMEYARKELESCRFLYDFIDFMKTAHHCTVDDVLAVFKKYSDNVTCKKISDDEIDYVIYFTDGVPDRMIYCIKFEMDHAHYHRFTKSDYQAFGYEL